VIYFPDPGLHAVLPGPEPGEPEGQSRVAARVQHDDVLRHDGGVTQAAAPAGRVVSANVGHGDVRAVRTRQHGEHAADAQLVQLHQRLQQLGPGGRGRAVVRPAVPAQALLLGHEGGLPRVQAVSARRRRVELGGERSERGAGADRRRARGARPPPVICTGRRRAVKYLSRKVPAVHTPLSAQRCPWTTGRGGATENGHKNRDPFDMSVDIC
jgi:hypothetical protein